MGTSTYLIALGSNVRGRWGRPQMALRIAIQHLRPTEHGSLSVKQAVSGVPWTLKQVQGDGLVSKIFETVPLGPSMRRYANAVARVESALSPPEMLAHLKTVERAHGRRPGRRWGDRPLDLDIIGWSGGIWASRGLTIPHPAFRTRGFVLAPLVEIAPGWRDPVTGLSARHLLARLDRKRPRA